MKREKKDMPNNPPTPHLSPCISPMFAGMTATPALELLAEAQTLSEGASANLIMFGIQIFAIIVTYLTNILATPGLGVILCVFVFCCIAILLFVKEVYLRLDTAPHRY